MKTPIGRLEASGARVTAAHAVALAATSPSSGAETRPFRGGALVAWGPGRYVNRAIGVGDEPFTAVQLDEVEQFFDRHAVQPSIEITSAASKELLQQLAERCMHAEWFRNVFARPLDGHGSHGGTDIEIRRVASDDEFTLWCQAFNAGFEVPDGEPRAIAAEHAAAVRASESIDLVALVDGASVGCASMSIDGDVAWFGGAATVPGHRGRGVQSALLVHRMRLAAEAGCTLAAATALPAGTSARNIERHGFRLVYAQLVFTASRQAA